uniref:DEAF-1 deformed epidermal autoregulatory factor 1 homolog n=1 Tax=Phallusia mammillata TaxID=59560 RepID=A0A6F9DA64_9ASCI|nr:DEAF-1 deformed epidermal autoregulatory factor 1 homolog [Phallusia mammillata]
MSDKTQENPRTNEVSTEKVSQCASGSSIQSEQSTEITVVTTRQDDSVFVLSTANASGRQTTLTNAALPPGIQLQAISGLKDASLGYIIPDGYKNGPNDEAVQIVEQTSVPSASSIKTLIVMTPVTKGANLTQVSPQVQPFQFALSKNSISPVASNNLSLPEVHSLKKQMTSPAKVPKVPTQLPRHTVLTTLSNVTSEHLSQANSPLPSPCFSSTESIPGTPATPLDKDPFASSDQIPVVCRKNKAVLDRRKLGSGQRGKCILFQDNWMTPSEFEIACGLSMSKDWKRSIRHGSGPTIQKLINEGYLLPHSAQCTCAVCSDDDSVTCPVRLFQPYKRRKRSAAGNLTPHSPIASPVSGKYLSTSESLDSPLSDLRKSATPVSHNAFFASPIPHKIKAANLQLESDNLIRSLNAETDLVEQRIWWQLEETSKGLLEQAQRLNEAVVEAKSLCASRRLHLMQKLASQLNKERIHVPHPEPPKTFYQMKSVATKQVTQTTTLQQAWNNHQASKLGAPKIVPAEIPEVTLQRKASSSNPQHCNTCGASAISECTGCHRATYCSTVCQEKDWLSGHSEICQKEASGIESKERSEPVTPVTISNEPHVSVAKITASHSAES